MEIGDRELLVGPVQVVVVLAPAQKQGVDAQLLLDQADDRNRAPFADEDGLRAETGLDRPDGGPHARGIGVDQNGRRTVVGDDLISHALGADPRDVLAELFLDGLRVLVGNQPEAELGAGLAGEHGLGAGAGITAEDPVDVAGGPRPFPLQRREAGLAFEARHSEIGLERRPRKRRARRTAFVPSRPVA